MANERIFISYRRLDQPNDVIRLMSKLEQELGSMTFVDVHSIEYGDDFAKTIGAALSDCEILLAVIGPRWEELLRERDKNEPDYVLVEIAEALKRGIPVVPMLLNRDKMPNRADMPPELHGLASHHALVLNGNDSLQELSWAINCRFLEAKYSGQGRINSFIHQEIMKGCKDSYSIASMLANKSSMRILNVGETLYPKKRAIGNSLYFVFCGSFSLRAGGWHNYLLEPNEVVGEFPLLLKTQPKYAVEITAREPSVVARVPENDFKEIADANPGLWEGMSRTLVERLIDSNKKRRRMEMWATAATGAFVLVTITLIVTLALNWRG